MTNYELHPLCTLFPRVTGAEFQCLVDDIKDNGLRQPIVLHGGMVLDGGNRYRACVEAGVAPTFTEFTGDSVVSFVLSANLHRRHLTPGQQAAIVASAQDWAKAQTHGGSRSSVLVNTCLDTTEKRAAQSGASVMTQRRADKVAKADPELAKQVAHGEVSLPKAVAQVDGKAPKAQPSPPAQDGGAAAAAEAPATRSAPKKSPTAAEFDADEVIARLRADLAASADQIDELKANLRTLMDDNESMAKVFEADDKAKAAMAEATKLRFEVSGLRERVNSMLNESGAQIRRIKAMQAKLKKAGLE